MLSPAVEVNLVNSALLPPVFAASSLYNEQLLQLAESHQASGDRQRAEHHFEAQGGHFNSADRLDGFKGHAIGLGPIFTYSKKVGKGQLDMNGRWVHEFDASNRPEGDTLLFSVSSMF